MIGFLKRCSVSYHTRCMLVHSNIIGNRTVEVKSISIPATHISQNFWCHFCEAWIMHFCLWDHKRRDDRCKCIKASTRTKMMALLFCHSQATYSRGLMLKTGDGWNKKLREEVQSWSDCPSSPALNLHALLLGGVSDWRWLRGWNDRLFKLSVPQTYSRSTAGL